MDPVCKVIPWDEPQLKALWEKALPIWEGRFGHLGEYRIPQIWWGIEEGDELLSAAGADLLKDGTVHVVALLCKPCKAGLAAFATMAVMLRVMAAQGRKLQFYVATDNKRMLRLAHDLGANPVSPPENGAVLLEV